jgi:phosphatidylglycerophosphate synthase
MKKEFDLEKKIKSLFGMLAVVFMFLAGMICLVLDKLSTTDDWFTVAWILIGGAVTLAIIDGVVDIVASWKSWKVRKAQKEDIW